MRGLIASRFVLLDFVLVLIFGRMKGAIGPMMGLTRIIHGVLRRRYG